MSLNDLEKRILDGAVRAQNTYQKLTGGWWLWHGPEFFLSHEVARSIGRGKGSPHVYMEASPKKVAAEHDKPLRGRPAKDQQKRFDIVVWMKTENYLRAVIEVKRASNPTQVMNDAAKLEKYLGHKNAHGTGYLLVYSEASGIDRRKDLNKRINNLNDLGSDRGWKVIGWRVRTPRGKNAGGTNNKTWGWSVCVLRYGIGHNR